MLSYTRGKPEISKPALQDMICNYVKLLASLHLRCDWQCPILCDPTRVPFAALPSSKGERYSKSMLTRLSKGRIYHCRSVILKKSTRNLSNIRVTQPAYQRRERRRPSRTGHSLCVDNEFASCLQQLRDLQRHNNNLSFLNHTSLPVLIYLVI